MDVLDNYFKLFDEAKESEASFNKLNALFSDDITFVLNGRTFNLLVYILPFHIYCHK